MPDQAEPVDLSDLRAADPVRLADLPRADSPAARRLLADTISTTPSPSARPTGRLRRLLPAGAVAAALAILAAGFAVFGPSGTEPALAAVKAAAQEVAAADSGRVETTFRLDRSDGTDEGTVAGTAVLTYNDDDLAVTVELDELPADLQRPSTFGALETRLVDGVLYGRGGGLDGWVAAEVPEAIGRELGTLVDPRTVLDTVQDLVEADLIGEVVIGGETLTQYRSLIDLGDESLADSGWLSGLQTQIDVNAEGTVTVELYVDADGRLRRLDVSGDVADAERAEHRAAFSVSTVFGDFGAVPPIEAPTGVEPLAGLEGLFGRDGG